MARAVWVVLVIAALSAAAAAVACNDNGQVTVEGPNDAAAAPVDQSAAVETGANQPCDATHACRAGLMCNPAGTCIPAHSSGEGTGCVISDECAPGDYCGPVRTCVPAGHAAAGANCASDADCTAGLRCNVIGFSAECQPEGTHDVGAACGTNGDCYGGLACQASACAPLPLVPGGLPPLALPNWPGAVCADDPGPTKAYFHVPRGRDDGDFYRLPFPNDLRTKAGHPDLSAHPTPGPSLLGFDLVDRYLRDVEQSADGFSPYSTVTLRFSGNVDFKSFTNSSFAWVKLPSGEGVSYDWVATTARNEYLCENSLSARPTRGVPLEEGTTYAFILKNPVLDTAGHQVVVDADFKAMLDPTVPSDSVLAAAWTKYQPLRDWAAANGGTGGILDAAVFTTGHPTVTPSKLFDAVASATPSTMTSWVKCDGSTPSPCPDTTGDRGCGAPDPAFDELHTLITLPIFQHGTEPYWVADQGGDLALDSTGVPHVERTEQVCLALTVPKGPLPGGGFPLVVYAHDTGGSFRSHVTDGVAAMLANAKDSTGAAMPIAVLGIDQVEHGTRRGASTEAARKLFYNYANPSAARGNVLQGAADQASLLRFAHSLLLAPAVTGRGVTFTSIGFWGHGQGAASGAIAMPNVAGAFTVAGVVMTGEGAGFVDVLVGKRNPVNIADVLPTLFGEASLDPFHPALTLVQTSLDPSDSVHYASRIAAHPLPAIGPKHILQSYGMGDTFSPPSSEAAFAIAAGLGVAQAPASVKTPDAIGHVTPLALPAGGNIPNGAAPITALVREYVPTPLGAYDGHWVATKDDNARADVATFFADALSGKTPKVGHP